MRIGAVLELFTRYSKPVYLHETSEERWRQVFEHEVTIGMRENVEDWVSAADFTGTPRVDVVRSGVIGLWLENHSNAPWNQAFPAKRHDSRKCADCRLGDLE